MHAMESISNLGLTPASAPEALATGSINWSATLLALGLAAADEGADRLDCLIDALDLSPAEFDAHAKKAIKLAGKEDDVDGFKPYEQTNKKTGKTREVKRGPKAATVAVQMSMARQAWGCMKQSGVTTLAGMGWVQGVKAAREWLATAGKTWDGDNIPTEEQESYKQAIVNKSAAVAEALTLNPGKTVAELDAEIEAIENRMHLEHIEEQAKKLLKAWAKLNPEVLTRAIDLYMADAS